MRRVILAMGLMGAAAAAWADGGTIEGTITLAGDPPAPEVKDVPADRVGDCGAKYTVTELMVDKATKGIQYAVAYIDKFPGAKVEPKTIESDQKDCVFMPHIVVAPVGTKILYKNSDKAAHNVNVKAGKNDSFNKVIPAGGAPVEWEAKASENVRVDCDFHAWMRFYVIVKDHPYVAVTDDKGNFKIENVPPGEYTVKCWHEKLGIQVKEGVKVKVEAGKAAKAEFAALKPK